MSDINSVTLLEDRDENAINIDYADNIDDTSLPLENDEEDTKDTELKTIKMRVNEIEEEAKRLCQLSKNSIYTIPAITHQSTEKKCIQNKILADKRSVYVGNVDYYTSEGELRHHFQRCGAIRRVTISENCDGPKGYAYIEFENLYSVSSALLLNLSLLRDRPIKVEEKRTNIPGYPKVERKRRYYTSYEPQYYFYQPY